MIGKHRFAAGRRHGLRLALAFAVMAAGSSVLLQAAPAQAQSPPSKLYHRGLRWVGVTARCASLPDWSAEPVFLNPQALPVGAGELCLYRWNLISQPPTPAQIAALFSTSGATNLIEDVPVVEPMQAASWTSEELAFYAGLRSSLLQHVGTAALLPALPSTPAARVVVIDSAPDAPHGGIRPGTSRHGDTLAHLIEDVVCRPVVPDVPLRECAAEVTTELALPWMAAGVIGPAGGRTGTLIDLARAIERAIVRWDRDKLRSHRTPRQLILNLSVGWEHTLDIADCFPEPAMPVKLPAALVQSILQYASSRGVLVLAAAGNDSGGPAPRTKLTCPGSYQALWSNAQPRPLLLAVSGVDYADRPLESVRPSGRTSLVGLAFGGMAWAAGDQAPPSLIGSSVATAVVSAVAALVWAHRPTWTPAQVARAVYDGGVPVPATPAQDCPLTFGCDTRRATACGALLNAGAAISCAPAPAKAWSSPPLPGQMNALIASFAGPPVAPAAVIESPPPSILPRYLAPSVQVEPWTFPMPIQATCPTCWAGMATPAGPPHLAVRNLGKPLYQPTLVVTLDPSLDPTDPVQGAVMLGGFLAAGSSLKVSLPPGWAIQSAYLTGFDDAQLTHSITEQIFVHR